MTTERWRRIEAIYNTTADLPVAERAHHLEAACNGDASLRSDVEKLLALDGDSGASLDRALDGAIRAQAEDLARDGSEPAAGHRFGAYRVTGVIACGGMGVVYRAVRDDEQFEKQVAIKVVHRG